MLAELKAQGLDGLAGGFAIVGAPGADVLDQFGEQFHRVVAVFDEGDEALQQIFHGIHGLVLFPWRICRMYVLFTVP